MGDEMSYPVHKLAEIFPAIGGKDFDALVASIKANGLRDPITIYEDAILDGRNRQRACDLAGVDAIYEPLPDDADPLQFVIDKNLNRRHLDESQRAMAAAKFATLKQGDNQHRSIDLTSQTAAAAALNVSVPSLKRAAKVQRDGTPELQHAVEAGGASVAAAAEIATLPEEEQRQAVAGGDKAIKAAAKAVKAAKKKKKRRPRYADSAAVTQSTHERDLDHLLSAWGLACESAREAFLAKIERPIMDRRFG